MIYLADGGLNVAEDDTRSLGVFGSQGLNVFLDGRKDGLFNEENDPLAKRSTRVDLL